MSDWRRIETAPDSTDDILLYCSDTGEQMVGFQIERGEYQFAVVRGPEHVHTRAVCTPTHWMPLPDPPESD